MKQLVLGITFLMSFSLSAQYQQSHQIPVISMLGDTLAYPWLGGIEAPILSNLDIDNDGYKDLVLFDRSSLKVHTFRNNGLADSISYSWQPHLAQTIPPLNRWIQIADYNCDGIEDIFTSENDQYVVYSGRIVNNIWTVQDSLHLISDGEPVTIFYNSIPAFDDIDSDGDIDFVVLNVQGKCLYYKNIQIEQNLSCNTVQFTLASQCWGNFKLASTTSPAAQLNYNCSEGIHPTSTPRHGTNGITLVDINNDHIKDAIVSDALFGSLLYLHNGGSPDSAIMISQDTLFPVQVRSVHFSFPYVSYLDLNNDHEKDLFAAAAGSSNRSRNTNWVFTVHQQQLSLYDTAFIERDMIDVGIGAQPVLADADGDNLTDLLIGNLVEIIDTLITSRITFYKNIGTTTQPVFQHITNDFANASQIKQFALFPTLADLDNDNDKDLLCGHYNYGFSFFRNIGTNTQPNYQFQYLLPYIGVGSYGTPILTDLNNDQLPDILSGSLSGNITYFQNNGNLQFTEISNFWCNIDVRPNYAYGVGYAVPAYHQNNLYVGNSAGDVFVYNTTNCSLSDTIHCAPYTNYAAPAVATLTTSTLPELIVGTERGGLILFQSPQFASTSSTPIPHPNSPNIFPIPAHHQLHIQPRTPTPHTIQLYTLQGQCIATYTTTPHTTLTIPTQQWASGTYIVHSTTPTHTYTQKIIIIHP